MADSAAAPPAQQGRAYGFKPGVSDFELARVGPGTPGGELLRRYWHPIAESADVKDLPLAVRILGEDLILFRAKSGRCGLLYPRCIHRGTSLFYGRVEEAGIRCCYHGWLFDVEGRCLDQPCEPQGGPARANFRQPWHRVEERYGLVWAYLGPPEHEPVLPRYELLEDLEGGKYELCADAHHKLSNDPQPSRINWLQRSENTVDPFHVYVLHNNMGREQFHSLFTQRPDVRFELTETGVKATAIRPIDAEFDVHRVNDLVFPNLAIVGDLRLHDFDRSVLFSWIVPVDDEHLLDIFVIRATKDIIAKIRSGAYAHELLGEKLWDQMSAEEHQRTPWDYEAQAGQGAITLHSEEHLATSDRGVVMYRRQLKENMRAVAEGRTPLNVSFDAAAPPIRIAAGNYRAPRGQ
ncbi:MAG: Rieske 2Fe-2S domain-containing protein [Hyphomonadaceae bacterium]